MSVIIATRNSLEPVTVAGDLVGIVNKMNACAAHGLDFVVLPDDKDDQIAVRLDNITTMKEYDSDSSIFG